MRTTGVKAFFDKSKTCYGLIIIFPRNQKKQKGFPSFLLFSCSTVFSFDDQGSENPLYFSEMRLLLPIKNHISTFIFPTYIGSFILFSLWTSSFLASIICSSGELSEKRMEWLVTDLRLFLSQFPIQNFGVITRKNIFLFLVHAFTWGKFTNKSNSYHR